MRRVIVQEFMTLDGFVAGSDGGVGFIPESTGGDQSFGRNQIEFIHSIDAMLLGRVTYEMFAGYWPNVKAGDDDKEFADLLNAVPKTVFSSTLDRAPWGEWPDAEIVKSDAAGKVASMRAAEGKNMVIWGSISLAQSLAGEGLVDEYQLIVCPVALGSGRTLFDANAGFRLQNAKTFESGVVLLTYSPRR